MPTKILTGWKENGVRTLQDVETIRQTPSGETGEEIRHGIETDPEHIDEPVQQL